MPHHASKGITVLGLAILAVPGLLPAGAAETIVFARDSHVLDAKRDLGAKADGVADDTAALQKGLAHV